MKQILNIIFIVFLPFLMFSQNVEENYLKKESYTDKLIQFDQLYGKSKTVPDNFKPEILVALSNFPELKETTIIFTGKKIKTTMQANPKYNFIFKSKKNRTYYVYFNNNKGRHKSIDFNNFTFNSQVGIIGHELSHIAYYSDKNSLILTGYGLLYLISHKFKMNFEKNTDIIAIKHNLGYSLYENRFFLLNNPNISEKSKTRTRTYYLSPKEILEFIDKLNY